MVKKILYWVPNVDPEQIDPDLSPRRPTRKELDYMKIFDAITDVMKPEHGAMQWNHGTMLTHAFTPTNRDLRTISGTNNKIKESEEPIGYDAVSEEVGETWYVWHIEVVGGIDVGAKHTVTTFFYLVPSINPDRIDTKYHPRIPNKREKVIIEKSYAGTAWGSLSSLGSVLDFNFEGVKWEGKGYDHLGIKVEQASIRVGNKGDIWEVWRIPIESDEPESWAYLQELIKKEE